MTLMESVWTEFSGECSRLQVSDDFLAFTEDR